MSSVMHIPAAQCCMIPASRYLEAVTSCLSEASSELCDEFIYVFGMKWTWMSV